MRAMSALPHLTPRQLWTLLALTLVWGLNWPIMKFGVSGFPPLSFRALSMWLGLPVLLGVLWWRRVPFRIPRADWPELLQLTVLNMLFWHTLAMLAIASLSSGRAAILGYTMPVFSALLGAWWFGQGLSRRAWGGVLAAAGYTLLAGWGVPAQRTLCMLVTVALLHSAGVRWPQTLVLLVAALAVSLLDPWALMQPGFWLSFVAVGLLMAAEPVQ